MRRVCLNLIRAGDRAMYEIYLFFNGTKPEILTFQEVVIV